MEKARELPGSMEKIEELLGGVDSWAAEVGCLLGEIGHKAPVEPQRKEYLQVKMGIHSLKYSFIRFSSFGPD